MGVQYTEAAGSGKNIRLCNWYICANMEVETHDIEAAWSGKVLITTLRMVPERISAAWL